jgi:hypothetical protein
MRLAAPTLALAALVGACTQSGTSYWYFEKPFDGRVYRVTCADLADSIVAARVRAKSLEDLIYQSGRVPVGPIVSAFEYSPELQRARADEQAFTAAAVSHRCPVPPSPDRVRAYRRR